jgi:hypothetical protein
MDEGDYRWNGSRDPGSADPKRRTGARISKKCRPPPQEGFWADDFAADA